MRRKQREREKKKNQISCRFTTSSSSSSSLHFFFLRYSKSNFDFKFKALMENFSTFSIHCHHHHHHDLPSTQISHLLKNPKNISLKFMVWKFNARSRREEKLKEKIAFFYSHQLNDFCALNASLTLCSSILE